MPRSRNWAEEVEDSDIEFLYKEGDYIYCAKEGFTFKVRRTSWPPKRLTPEVCTDPTGFYKHQVRKRHGDKYDLTLTVYTLADNLVKAVCPKHGEFEVYAKYFKSKCGCQLCGYENTGRLAASNTGVFTSRAIAIHGSKYDYSKVSYINSNTPVSIICPQHGEFSQIPYNHLIGKGCRLCGLENSKLSRVLYIEEVLQRFESVHEARYEYSNVVYTGDAHSLLEIICKDHGSFMQSYANHYHNKQGCPECAKEFSARLRSGFMKSADSKDYASLYLIECSSSDEVFFKIGITTKPLKTRFAGPSTMPYDYEVKYLLISGGEHIWNLERLLHYEYKDQKYLPLLEFGGRYECFSEIDVDEYKKLVYTLA